ncbi:MAG: Sporulation protein YunB [Thermoanaerobacterales bacterium 50_218]|nr:MAG: Sporulation protein YunB [Thermoanaerobacterales bacterium 50_218]
MNRKRPCLVLAFAASLLFLIFFFFESSLKPTIQEIAEAKARWAATEAVHQAVKQEFLRSSGSSDLIIVQKDLQGRIVLIQPDIVRVNVLASEATLAIQDSLKKLADDDFSIPLGQVLGSKLLANYGPRIKVSIYPVGTVKTKIFGRFEEAGINQTRHRLYLGVESIVKVVVPMLASEVKVATEIPVTDTVIVGEVPEMYLDFSKGTALK